MPNTAPPDWRDRPGFCGMEMLDLPSGALAPVTTRFLVVIAERLHAARVRLAELYVYPPDTSQRSSPVPQDQ